MTLRNRIKELANQKGLSLPNLESELDFGSGTIVKWDKSTPNVDKLQKVANYFGVTIDYLMTGEEPDDRYAQYPTQEERDIARKLDKIIDDINNDKNLCYDGEKIDDKSLKLLQDMLISVKRQVEIIKKNK